MDWVPDRHRRGRGDPTWRATHWLQIAVQGTSDDEVPWHDLITPLMVGTEGAALLLAKCHLAVEH